MSIIKNNGVPVTLDLADRAHIALNAMMGVADEEKGFIPFFSGFFASDPAWMSHGNWDYGSSHGRLVDSMTLVRAMTGTTEGVEIEKHYKENLLTFLKRMDLATDETILPMNLLSPVIQHLKIVLL